MNHSFSPALQAIRDDVKTFVRSSDIPFVLLQESDRERAVAQLLAQLKQKPFWQIIDEQQISSAMLERWIDDELRANASPIVTGKKVYAALRIPFELLVPGGPVPVWGMFPEKGEAFCETAAHLLNLSLGFCEQCGSYAPGQVEEQNWKSLCPACRPIKSKESS